MTALAREPRDFANSEDRWQHAVSASVWPDQRPVLTRSSTSKSSSKDHRSTVDPHDSASLLPRDTDEISPHSHSHYTRKPSFTDNINWVGRQNQSSHMPAVRASPHPSNNALAPGSAKLDGFWIDRDKLARIERLELEQSGLVAAGTFTHTPSRSPAYSDDEYGPVVDGDDPYDSDHDPSARSARSRQTAESRTGRTNGSTYDQSASRGPRSQSYDSTVERSSSHGSAAARPTRPSTSKIPIPKPSQSSVAAMADENARSNVTSPRSQSTTPASRKGTGSNTTTPLTTSSNNRTTTSRSPAPSKKSGGKTTPTNRPRMNSSSIGNMKRPGTSSGSSRAAPAKPTRVPEGDPPWLSAFRPDPRLPPDEQIIPTVAKRQMQEKWKQEGVLATAYDSNCEPLNSNDPFGRRPRRSGAGGDGDDDEDKIGDGGVGGDEDDDDVRPRTPVAPEAPRSSSGRSDTHGRYRTIPNIQKPGDVPPGSAGWGPPTPTAHPVDAVGHISTTEGVVRVPEPAEPVEKKGCAACCVVM